MQRRRYAGNKNLCEPKKVMNTTTLVSVAEVMKSNFLKTFNYIILKKALKGCPFMEVTPKFLIIKIRI